MSANIHKGKDSLNHQIGLHVLEASKLVPSMNELVSIITDRVAVLKTGVQPLVPVAKNQVDVLTALQELIARKIGPTPEEDAENKRLREYVDRIAEKSFPSLAGKR